MVAVTLALYGVTALRPRRLWRRPYCWSCSCPCRFGASILRVCGRA